jgi:AbiU2
VSCQSKTISYTDEEAKEVVKKFCAHVLWLISARHIFKVLYEDEQPSCKTLMEKTAPSFFNNIGRILHEYLLLESAKVTDDADTMGYTNFTVDYLVEKICWPKDTGIQQKLESLRTVTEDFRRYIKLARNKLLAHSDLRTVLSETSLGSFPENEDRKFFDALEEICNITHEACFGTIYGQMVPTSSGDVISLRQALRYAVAFKEALSESSDQNRKWLYSCLQKAGHEAARH